MTQGAGEITAPASEAEAAQAVLEARAKGRKFTIVGGGTRGGLGRPAQADEYGQARRDYEAFAFAEGWR